MQYSVICTNAHYRAIKLGQKLNSFTPHGVAALVTVFKRFTMRCKMN